MTTNLSWQSEFLSDAERKGLLDATLTTARGLELLVKSEEFISPSQGTRAFEMRSSPSNHRTTEGTTHVDNAYGMIAGSCLAAVDHMQAFFVSVRSLRNPRTTVSNWTLARGAIEALGRARYLLQADDSEDLLARYVALAHQEFRYAHLSGDYMTRGGGPIDVRAYEADLDEYLKEVGISPTQAPQITQMASELLETTAPGSDGRRRYSQLSGAAHGQTPSLGMFRTRDRGPLVFPRQLAREVVHMQVGCGLAVGGMISDRFTSVGETRDRWVSARDHGYLAVGMVPKVSTA